MRQLHARHGRPRRRRRRPRDPRLQRPLALQGDGLRRRRGRLAQLLAGHTRRRGYGLTLRAGRPGALVCAGRARAAERVRLCVCRSRRAVRRGKKLSVGRPASLGGSCRPGRCRRWDGAAGRLCLPRSRRRGHRHVRCRRHGCGLQLVRRGGSDEAVCRRADLLCQGRESALWRRAGALSFWACPRHRGAKLGRGVRSGATPPSCSRESRIHPVADGRRSRRGRLRAPGRLRTCASARATLCALRRRRAAAPQRLGRLRPARCRGARSRAARARLRKLLRKARRAGQVRGKRAVQRRAQRRVRPRGLGVVGVVHALACGVQQVVDQHLDAGVGLRRHRRAGLAVEDRQRATQLVQLHAQLPACPDTAMACTPAGPRKVGFFVVRDANSH